MMTKVCKDCTDRYPACWGSCSKYQEARAEHEKRKQAKAKDLQTYQDINAVRHHGKRQRREWKTGRKER